MKIPVKGFELNNESHHVEIKTFTQRFDFNSAT